MQQRLTILTIGVKDLELMTKFYQEKFGWKLTSDSNEHISFFKLNSFLFSLYPREKLAEDARVELEKGGFKGFTMAYNLTSEGEVNSFFLEMKNKGVEIIKAPEKVFWGGYSGYVSDPEGNLWEIAYNPYLKMDDLGNVN